MECGDSSPLFGEGFSLTACRFGVLQRPRYRRDLPVRSAYRRDLPVRSAVLRWIIQSRSRGHDERAPPRHPSEGPACQVRISEGPACQVRLFRIDRSLWFTGHDERAPPRHPSEGPACHVRILEGPACQVRISEGPACQVRLFRIDRSLWFTGHDERAPPRHPSEGPACQVRILEGPACRVR
ncbi:MAG: hypothetical protein KatS3mg112_0326 [Thermogutta sp.]|nr:MAG: hypothetical protein KatS3mg112_0326 [Thermogutta sp.]